LGTLHVALNNYGAEEDRLDGSGDSFDWHNQTPIYPRLHTLYYSDNGITSWWTVCRLGRLFPGLEHLVLLGNPLSHIPAPLPAKETVTGVKPVDEVGASLPAVNLGPIKPTPLTGKLTSATQSVTSAGSASPNGLTRPSRLFGSLHTLGLSETLINRWESVDALGEWMPNMTNLRLGNTLPVFQV
uniref:Leucine-rich repeat-containing protein 43 n=1 Tax=Echinostoma caproni TaxID=27848 RepID=A0A183BDP0_9TREM